MMGLPYGEEITIVGRTVWTQCTSVTDRRTDGQTDRRTDRITITKTVQRIASHGKNSACPSELQFTSMKGTDRVTDGQNDEVQCIIQPIVEGLRNKVRINNNKRTNKRTF